MKQYLCNTGPGSLNFSCSIHPTKVQLEEIRRHGALSHFQSVTQVCLFKYLLYQPRNNNLFWRCNNHNSKATFKEARSFASERGVGPRKHYLKWNLKPWQPRDSSVMLQLVLLLITFTYCQQKNLAQEARRLVSLCISGWSIFHFWILWFLPSVKEKLILTVLNLLIQAICQKPSLHMVPYHLIFTGGCFSKHYSKYYICPKVNMWHPVLLSTVFKYRGFEITCW